MLLLLAIGILWSGAYVAQAVARYVSERAVITDRQDAYRGTATALAPDAAALSARVVSAAYVRPARVSQFVTNTPPAPAIEIATNTPAATHTPVFTATSAAPTTDVSATPRPLPTLLMPGNVAPQVAAPTAIPTQVPVVDRHGQDIVNILLIGNDGEITHDGFLRTDTMIVVSVNRSAGTVSMLSFPRDLFVYMPGWTMQRMNVAYIHGEASGWTDGGFGLLRETIYYNFGINVHYYAMVDLTGFKSIVDTLGGIDIAVDCALQNLPLIGAEVPKAATAPDADGKVVLPVGYYHLSGPEALWYARSRDNSTDFDRGRRQQQVLRAIWRAARAGGQLQQIPQLWNEGIKLIQTNLTLDDALSLVPVAANLDITKLRQFTMRRLYDTTPWQTPDGDYVQLPNYDHILELLNAMYTPPTQNQLKADAAKIAIYNGTGTANLDKVAADRLGWDGYTAEADGAADKADYKDTVVIDYTGTSKGSSLGSILKVLGVNPKNVQVQPDPNRTVDYKVILGSGYNSCTYNVLPVTIAK